MVQETLNKVPLKILHIESTEKLSIYKGDLKSSRN